MKSNVKSPIGVCAMAPSPQHGARIVGYPDYVHEILEHAGLCYTDVRLDDLAGALAVMKVLVTVGDLPVPDEAKEPLREWLRCGGTWLAVGGPGGMPEVFGAEVESATYVCWGGGAGVLGEGYMKPTESDHPALAHIRIPLHFFDGVPVRPAGGRVLAEVLDKHHRPTLRAAMLEARVGDGRCVLIATDLTGTVVHIQQGFAVTRDGVPSPDGTASICDGVLKSDDGQVLDWWLDREPVPGVPGFSAFLRPVADQWREVLLRSIFYLASCAGAKVPLLWLYPRDLPAIGHISHDTDICEPDKGRKMLEVLESAGINSTWCNILPGYPTELMEAIRQAGHELAMHYDAMSDGKVWSEGEFDSQWKALTEMFGGQTPVTNKNHYLRWEGDVEFYEWCVKRGIRLDQSKGASKTGEAGFGFGSCHPYFPVAPDGSKIDVLELATPTQDLMVFAPEELVDPMLEAVHGCHGVLHLLFHPAHIEKPGVADALTRSVEKAKGLGMEWWTAQRISDWERARRNVHWVHYAEGEDGAEVSIEATSELEEACVLWLSVSADEAEVDGEKRQAQKVRRWGFEFNSVPIHLRPGVEHRIAV